MAIRINSGGRASGAITLPDYPFTMLCYFQGDAAGGPDGEIIALVDTGTPLKLYNITHGLDDDVASNFAPDTQVSIRKMTDMNPLDSDFTTWWALMATIKADGHTVEFRGWSGVGSNALLLGDSQNVFNNLGSFFLPVQTATIGPTGSKHVKIQEVVIIDRVLTTGQLDLWTRGIPAPQANLPGNIIFYQPLVTGYNEPTSVGTVSQSGTVESVVGPVLVSIENNIDIVNGAINLQANYGQSDSDASGILSNSDSGVLTYNLLYDEGIGLGAVGNIYHNNISVTSGAVQIIDLQVGTFDPVNLTFNRGMSRIKSVTLENKSGTGDLYLDFSAINSSSVFRDMFGDPSGQINLPANSCYHINDGTSSGYIVDSNNSDLVISGGAFAGTGTLFVTIMGDR